jgi:hypothetical protein
MHSITIIFTNYTKSIKIGEGFRFYGSPISLTLQKTGKKISSFTDPKSLVSLTLYSM